MRQLDIKTIWVGLIFLFKFKFTLTAPKRRTPSNGAIWKFFFFLAFRLPQVLCSLLITSIEKRSNRWYLSWSKSCVALFIEHLLLFLLSFMITHPNNKFKHFFYRKHLFILHFLLAVANTWQCIGDLKAFLTRDLSDSSCPQIK